MTAVKILFFEKKLTRDEERAAGASLIRELLTECAPELKDAELMRAPSGKPYIKDSEAVYSVSHTKGAIICTLSVRCVTKYGLIPLPDTVQEGGTYLVCEDTFADIGCDCEEVDRNRSETWLTRLSRRFYSTREREKLASTGDLHEEFFKVWCAKEALVKCTGEGLGGICRDSEEADGDFTVFSFRLAHGDTEYCGAICGKR